MTVYIVGAGPGDPDLLTVRAVELLGRADVVLYDRLVHPDVLKLAPNAMLIDVGKRPGSSAEGQRMINDALVEHGRSAEVVVRLKGGDPFVFGRGGEEAAILADAGIAFEIVPGVTSAIAAPAYAGIPLTHRDHASWAVIATGHEDPTKDDSALDWEAIARAPSAVFLMGIERISTIVSELLGHGRAPGTPVAVVASATLPQQRVLRTTLERVASDVATVGIRPPAVLVVGETVPVGELLDWVGARPLHGKRVFVTRARAQASKLVRLLREAGADVIEAPTIAIVEPTSYAALDGALSDPSVFEWILFTSTNAVSAVFDRLTPRDARAFGGCRIGAVGASTARELAARGISADLVPTSFSSQALASDLGRADGPRRTVLLPQAEDAPPDLATSLRAGGWEVTVAPVYRTVTLDSSVASGREAIDAGIDVVLFTSASTVHGFVDRWGKPPAGSVVVCIGPRTAEAAEAADITVDGVAEQVTIEALVGAAVDLARR
ncbi:MAG: uroporphyrinogen-III C-methyltransferase [Actinomycetota bacterium]